MPLVPVGLLKRHGVDRRALLVMRGWSRCLFGAGFQRCSAPSSADTRVRDPPINETTVIGGEKKSRAEMGHRLIITTKRPIVTYSLTNPFNSFLRRHAYDPSACNANPDQVARSRLKASGLPPITCKFSLRLSDDSRSDSKGI